MRQNAVRWGGEYMFVLTVLMLLKSVLFPFILWWWFPMSDMAATLMEATALVFSVITIIILLGLGSISRHHFRLPVGAVIATYGVINLPFYILWAIPLTRQWADSWWGVVGDGVQLWLPAIADNKGFVLFLAGVGLILTGRLVYVRDDARQPSQTHVTERGD